MIHEPISILQRSIYFRSKTFPPYISRINGSNVFRYVRAYSLAEPRQNHECDGNET